MRLTVSLIFVIGSNSWNSDSKPEHLGWHPAWDLACTYCGSDLSLPYKPAYYKATRAFSMLFSALLPLCIQIDPSIGGKKPAIHTFPTLLSAMQMLSLFSFEGSEVSPNVFLQKILKNCHMIYIDNPLSRCQMPSQCSTLPLLINTHPPTFCICFQTQQPDCRVLIQGNWKRQLVLSHRGKNKIRTWHSGCVSIRYKTILVFQHYHLPANKVSNHLLLPAVI